MPRRRRSRLPLKPHQKRAAAALVVLSVAAAGHAPAGRGASDARRLWSPSPCALQRCSPSRGYASLLGAEAARWDEEEEVATAEARRLMRLANVDALKQQLGEGEVIPYADLLRVCQEAGAACLPVLLAAGYPCLFVRCLNSRMTHQPIPCGGGLPVRSGESTGRDAAGLRS